MNIYIRYFDNEVLVSKLEEVYDFLQSLPDVDLDDFLRGDIAQFVASNSMYPKRYKVHGRSYFIVIKTTAKSMDEFKKNGSAARDAAQEDRRNRKPAETNEEYRPGWYEGSLVFKRVIPIPQTQKFQYVDTVFAARVKAYNRLDCYNKIIDHLRSRQDIDPRCQFPSAKGRNFECHYKGME